MKSGRSGSTIQAHPALSKQIGDVVRAARIDAKLTQADVAERVGLQTEVYGRLERGTMLPSVPTLFRIACVLKLSSDVMIGLADERAAEAKKPVGEESSPELRRLLRTVRKLGRGHLKLFTLVANALRKKGQESVKRQKEQKPE